MLYFDSNFSNREIINNRDNLLRRRGQFQIILFFKYLVGIPAAGIPAGLLE